jgi:hypothetical protein
MPPPPPGPVLPPPQPGTAAFLPPPPYLPPSPSTAPPAAPSARRNQAVVVALVAVLGLLSVAGLLSSVDRGPKGPAHPDVWDPRVVELVAFVERERGLTFEHPVFIDFLPAEEIARQLRAAMADPDGEALAAAARQASQLRALGLISGDVDLLASVGTLTAEGVVAFYDPVSERITAPDGELGPRQRAVMVHELTHVLQDQHFDLDRTRQSAPAPDTYRAVVEGDASRIEQRYVDQLPVGERESLHTAHSDAYDDYEAATASVAPTLDAFQAAPYLLGEGMVNTLFDFDGQAGIDAVLRRPPRSDEALVDPSHYRGNGSVVAVSQPSVVAGEELVDQGTLGPLVWYLMLAEVTDSATAVRASFGWGGDAYVMVASGEQNCVRINYRGDSTADLRELEGALGQWAAAAPQARREIALVGDELRVTACDPGPDVAIPLAGTPTDALLVPRMIMEMAVELHAQGFPYTEARCVGLEFVAQYTVSELSDFVMAAEPTAEQLAQRDARAGAAVAACA